MIINKRSGTRKQLDLYVDVESRGESLGLYQTRDINLNGAFLNNCGSTLHPSDTLELQFHIHDGESSPLRLRATVTRATDEGVAVLFDYRAQEYRRLLNLLSTYATNGHTLKIPGFWYLGMDNGHEQGGAH